MGVGNRFGLQQVGGTVETEWGPLPRSIEPSYVTPEQRDKQNKAMALKKKGLTTKEIAEKMGVHPQTAKVYLLKAAKRALKKNKPVVFRAVEYDRIETIRNELWDKIVNDEHMVDYRALTHWENLNRTLREMFGVDMPKQLKIEGTIIHDIATEKMSDLQEYMNLADRLIQQGYGSGRASKEIEAARDDIQDAEIVDPDPAS